MCKGIKRTLLLILQITLTCCTVHNTIVVIHTQSFSRNRIGLLLRHSVSNNNNSSNSNKGKMSVQ